jgi:chitinase
MSQRTLRKLFTCFIVVAVAITAFLVSFTPANPANAKHIKHVGYLTSWSGSVSAMQFSKLTHVNYAFVIPNADGSVGAVPDTAKLQSLVSDRAWYRQLTPQVSRY